VSPPRETVNDSQCDAILARHSSEATRTQPRAGARLIAKSGEAPRGAQPEKTAAKIAEAAKVSTRTVERVQKIEREDPEAFERLAKTGELPRSATAARRKGQEGSTLDSNERSAPTTAVVMTVHA
jgi:hypothetical protein